MKLAVFDLDGTIADTLCDLADAVNAGLRDMGYPVHRYDEYRYMVGNGAAKLCERALPEGAKERAAELRGLFDGYYRQHYLDKTRLYDGMTEVMEKLSASDVRLAVATNKPEVFAQAMIAMLLPDTDFVRVLGGRPDRPVKPDTAIISEILSALPEGDVTAYMIGDSNVDIQTAQNAGIIGIGCAWGFRGRTELENAGADFIAEIPDDIVTFICN
ncbi:MAG: HAD-IA family hydrolase [Ruminococcus sp.]|nr:HAD-IA family hydrolase [Ruminococcus sp.]